MCAVPLDLQFHRQLTEPAAHIIKSALLLDVTIVDSPLRLHRSGVSLAEVVALLWQNDETGVVKKARFGVDMNSVLVLASALVDLMLVGRIALNAFEGQILGFGSKTTDFYVLVRSEEPTDSAFHTRLLAHLASEQKSRKKMHARLGLPLLECMDKLITMDIKHW